MAFYRKTIPSSAPRDYAAWEAAGLRWLAQATPAGGVRVVEVLEVGERHLNLERFAPCQPTPAQAEDFGRALAATHIDTRTIRAERPEHDFDLAASKNGTSSFCPRRS